MTPLGALTFATLAIAGFTACAEFGSYAFVHPVIRKLDVVNHVAVERGLVKTFGRVMPFLMTGSLILIISWAIWATEVPMAIRVAATAIWGFGLVTTILVNVGINLRTSKWDPESDAGEWKAMRERWELFQGIRSWAFLISFLIVAFGVSLLL